MAYMNQEKKATIAAELKKVLPKHWKASLSVRNHSTIVCTITAGPVILLDGNSPIANNNGGYFYREVNVYHPNHSYAGELLATIEKVIAALNLNNYDKSDIMTDYFDVGHYVELHVGRWDKPYKVTS